MVISFLFHFFDAPFFLVTVSQGPDICMSSCCRLHYVQFLTPATCDATTYRENQFGSLAALAATRSSARHQATSGALAAPITLTACDVSLFSPFLLFLLGMFKSGFENRNIAD